MAGRHRFVNDMVDQYYDDEEYYDDYGYDDEEHYAPPPKPKPKPPPKTAKTATPKKLQNSPKSSPKATPKKDPLASLTKKIGKINVNSEIENRLKSETPIVYMVVIGHVDSGKSTLVGQLAVNAGNLTRGERNKLQQAADEAGKSSFGLAFMMDQTETERERGVTVDVGAAKHITLDTLELALLDAPGHRDFVPAMITNGACACDVAMLILDGSVGKFEAGFSKGGQTREHIFLTRGLGCTKLIVAVNKMDTVGFQKSRFDQIKAEMSDFLKQTGFGKKDAEFCPISGLSGVGVQMGYSGDAAWYDGPTLLQLFEKISIPDRTALRGRPLRASVSESWEDTKGLTVRMRIECGTLHAGNRVRICPKMEDAIVTEVVEPPHKVAMVGDIVEVRLSGTTLEEVAPISIISSFDLAIPKSSKVRCQVKIIPYKSRIPVTPGLPVTFFSRGNSTNGHIKKINALLDRNGAVIKARPKVIKSGDVAEVEVNLSNPICIESFDDVKELSRVIIRYGSETIAIGKAVKVLIK